eukprot:scaffold2963_cov250-Pinguiococcus_pyrenoidosus.AAC.39
MTLSRSLSSPKPTQARGLCRLLTRIRQEDGLCVVGGRHGQLKDLLPRLHVEGTHAAGKAALVQPERADLHARQRAEHEAESQLGLDFQRLLIRAEAREGPTARGAQVHLEAGELLAQARGDVPGGDGVQVTAGHVKHGQIHLRAAHELRQALLHRLIDGIRNVRRQADGRGEALRRVRGNRRVGLGCQRPRAGRHRRHKGPRPLQPRHPEQKQQARPERHGGSGLARRWLGETSEEDNTHAKTRLGQTARKAIGTGMYSGWAGRKASPAVSKVSHFAGNIGSNRVDTKRPTLCQLRSRAEPKKWALSSKVGLLFRSVAGEGQQTPVALERAWGPTGVAGSQRRCPCMCG